MKSQEWADLLEKIYENDEYWNIGEDELTEVAKELNLEEEEVSEKLDNLKKQGLIERDIDQVTLTKRGFDLINRRKNHEEQLITDRLLVIFTTVLTLGVFVMTGIALQDLANPVVTISYYGIFALMFMALGIVFNKKFE